MFDGGDGCDGGGVNIIFIPLFLIVFESIVNDDETETFCCCCCCCCRESGLIKYESGSATVVVGGRETDGGGRKTCKLEGSTCLILFVDETSSDGFDLARFIGRCPADTSAD
jgi:hypothetical protein